MSSSSSRELQIAVITNPNSRKNKLRPGRAELLRRVLGDQGMVFETKSLEAVDEAVREMRAKDIRYWVADGGDGCLFWMLNKAAAEASAGIDALPDKIPFVVPANGGTIDFVAKKAGISGRSDAILARLARQLREGQEPPFVSLPSIRVSLERRGATEPEPEIICFSTALAGFACRFFDQLYALESRNTLKITSMFFTSVYAAVMRRIWLSALVPGRWMSSLDELFRPHELRVLVDGAELPWNKITTLNASAFNVNFGGVFRFFPEAKDGRMHVIAGEPTEIDVALNTFRMMTARKLVCDALYDGPAKELRVEAIGDEALKPVLDGEVFPDVQAFTMRVGPEIRVAVVRAGWI